MRERACIGFAVFLSTLACSLLSGQSTEVHQTAVIADVHPSAPNTIPEMRKRFLHGRYELRNATMLDLIRTAWDVDADNVAGGPEWLGLDRFDVIVSAPAGSSPKTLNTLLQRLLAGRFHLAARRDTKELPAWVLTADRKVQLQESHTLEEGGCSAAPAPDRPQLRGASPPPVRFVCRNMTMAAFAGALPKMRGAPGYLFNYPVVDRTGLKGEWDFDFEWAARTPGSPPAPPGATTTIFDAVENQLGLKLSLTRVPTPVVVVDAVNEKPTPNPPGVEALLGEKPPGPLRFEVAAIKPDDQSLQGGYVAIQPGGRVQIRMTLKGLIQEAWGDMSPHRVIGNPELKSGTRFMVVAKAPVQENPVNGWVGPVWNGVDLDSMRMMLRALLIDRFKLAAHNEDRLVPGYALVAAEPKLRKANPSNRPGCREGPGPDGKDPRLRNPAASRLITCLNVTLTQFTEELNTVLYGYPPVADLTGIHGRYDMTINFTPLAALPNIEFPTPGRETVASEPDGTIPIFDALPRQLGLKLQSRKVVAPVLVVDHVNEMPTEN